MSLYANSTLSVKLQNKTIRALVDSGSCVNCIKFRILKDNFPHIKISDKPHGVTFKGANDSRINCVGIASIPIKFMDKTCISDVYVFDDIGQSLILGRPFLIKHNVIVDYGRSTFAMHDHIIDDDVNDKNNDNGVGMIDCNRPAEKTDTVSSEYISAVDKIDTDLLNVQNRVTNESHENETNNTQTVQKNNNTLDLQAEIQISKDMGNVSHKCVNFKDLDEVINLEEKLQIGLEKDNASEDNTMNSEIPYAERLEKLCLDFTETALEGDDMLKLKQLLGRHAYTFAADETELGRCEVLKHEIRIKPSASPCFRRPYRVSPEVEKEVERQLENLLKQGVIEEVDSPKWSNPLLTVVKGVKKSQKHVSKPSSGIRICIDYRALNAASYRTHDKIILPTARELIDTIGKAKPKFISALDLRAGFWQISLEESSRDYTAFNWMRKFYRWNVLPMGLATSSWQFQRVMYKILGDVVGKGVVVYLDDIICYSSTKEEHMKLLEYIFDSFAKAHLRLHPKKCKFFTTEGVFLGFKISEDGISISDQHLRAIREYPAPKNAREVRTVIGLFSFFRDFIDKRAELMQALIEVSKNDVPFIWTDKQEKAFMNMRDQLTSDLVLAFPDFEKDFIVQTDASGIGIGGLLLQKNEQGRLRPVCYAGRALNKHEKSASSAHLELLALVYCIVQFDVYLADKHFDIYTDCIALKYIFAKTNNKLSRRMARLVLTVESYDFTVHYKKGTVNRAADALSRAQYTWTRTSADDTLDQFPNVFDEETCPTGIENEICELVLIDEYCVHEKMIATDGNITTNNPYMDDIDNILLTQAEIGIHMAHFDTTCTLCDNRWFMNEVDIEIENEINFMSQTITTEISNKTEDENVIDKLPCEEMISPVTRNKKGESQNLPTAVRYYKNLEYDEGRTIEEILSSYVKKFKKIENDHNVFYWLFPGTKPNKLNALRPFLNEAICDMFINDDECMMRFHRVYQMILGFMGFKMTDDESGLLETTSNHIERFENLTTKEHNTRRTTRILRFLKSINYVKWQSGLLRALSHEVVHSDNCELAKTCREHWNTLCIDKELQAEIETRLQPMQRVQDEIVEPDDLQEGDMLINDNVLPKEHNTRSDKNVLPEAAQSIMKYGFDLERIKSLQKQDQFCSDLIMWIKDRTPPPTNARLKRVLCRDNNYYVEDDTLYHTFTPIPSQNHATYITIVVPSVIQEELVKRVHESCTAAHIGPKKLHSLMKHHFSLPNLLPICIRVCAACIQCQQNKKTNPLQKSVRTLFEVSCMPWERVHFDAIGPFVTSNTQMKYIFVLVDSYSGFIIAWPMRNLTTPTIVKNMYTKLIHTYGTPRLMVCDRAPQHLTEMFTTMMNIYGIKLRYTVSYRAQGNGLCERQNQSVVNCLRTLVHDFPKQWDSYLPAVISALNNTIHDPIGLNPYTVLYGVPMRMEFDNEIGNSVEQPRHEIMEEILTTQRHADEVASKLHMERAKKVKNKFDKENLAPVVVPGTIVFLKQQSAENLGESF